MAKGQDKTLADTRRSQAPFESAENTIKGMPFHSHAGSQASLRIKADQTDDKSQLCLSHENMADHTRADPVTDFVPGGQLS